MRELSVFCDESGDFGPLTAHSPLYIVSLVFHDQSKSIEDPIMRLEESVKQLGLPANHAIHTAPLIRREQDYANFDWQTRRRLFGDISSFMRHCDVSSKTFLLKKKEFRIVKPEDYHLFQVADLVCTLELLDYKRNNSMLNSSELAFFEGANRLKKNYLKTLYAKRM